MFALCISAVLHLSPSLQLSPISCFPYLARKLARPPAVAEDLLLLGCNVIAVSAVVNVIGNKCIIFRKMTRKENTIES